MRTLDEVARQARLSIGFEMEAALSDGRKRDLAAEMAQLLDTPADTITITDGYSHHSGDGWKLSSDCSIRTPGEPVEVQSPVFWYPSEAAAAADAVAEAMASLGGRAGRSCGMHVHIGRRSDGLSNDERHAAFLAYARWESALDELQPSWRRGDVNRYCGSLWSGVYCDASGWYQCPFPGHPLFNPPGAIRYAQNNRYYKLNTTAPWTVEVRHGAGTTDGTVAAAWLRVAVATVAAALLDPDSIPEPDPMPHRWISPWVAERVPGAPGRVDRLAAFARWLRRAAGVDLSFDIFYLASKRARFTAREQKAYRRAASIGALWELM